MNKASTLFVLVVALHLALPARVEAEPAEAMAEAERHFRLGLELASASAWDSALAEFDRSRALHSTPIALQNAAVCLRELGRYDEALAVYAQLNAEFGGKLGPVIRREVNADVAQLSRWVGNLEVSAEPGATVVVDGKVRGKTPLDGPIVVTVGTRTVGLRKDGFAPFDTRVQIASRETRRVEATMVAVSRLGKVRVVAPKGFDVTVDGAVVGKTPWEGTLTIGVHRVSIRSERDEGSAPRFVEVRMGETTEITESPVLLPGRLRVEPTPIDALVTIDGVEVARGSVDRELASRSHAVRVSSDWYVPFEDTVRVTSREPQAVRPELAAIPRAYLELQAGVVPLYDAGAQLGLGACSDVCIGGFSSLRGGYLLLPELAAELFVTNFFLPHQATTEFPAFSQDFLQDVRASYRESATANLFFSGLGLRLQFFETTPLTLRLSGGIVRGLLDQEGDGTFPISPAEAGGPASTAFFGYEAHSVTYWAAAAMPEVRLGYRFGSGLTVNVGVGLLLTHAPVVRRQSRSPEDFVLTSPEGRDPTPPSSSFAGGFVHALPVSAAFQLEL